MKFDVKNIFRWLFKLLKLIIFITGTVTILFILLFLILGFMIRTEWLPDPFEPKIDKQVYSQLEEYRPTINYIENYYRTNKKYPKSIKKPANLKYFPYYTYKTFNDGTEFILHIGKREHLGEGYRYCSSDFLPICKDGGRVKGSGYHTQNSFRQVGDWIEELYY
jgi:hypothetical protein